MKSGSEYVEGIAESRMMKRLNKLRYDLTDYRNTEQFRRYGFDIIRPWTKVELKNKTFLKRLLEETDVLPSRGLEIYVDDYFPKTDDGT